MKKLSVSLLAISTLVAGMITATPAFALDASCTKIITASNSTFEGTGGDDVICIDADNVIVKALAGNDKVIDYGFGNIIELGNGTDQYDGTDGSQADVDGGLGNDTITGTPGDDDIVTGEGDDTVYAGGGNDSVSGGNGNDLLNGNAGVDNLQGEAGDDTLNGGEGTDTIAGGDGDDSLIGGAADDNLRGGEGNDTLVGSAGADNIWGESGTDELQGSEGDDIIAGGDGTDTLDGGWGLNLCDYDNMDPSHHVETCIYDDNPPEISGFSWDSSSYNVTKGNAKAIATFELTDEVAVLNAQVACFGNGTTAYPVNFGIFWDVDHWTLYGLGARLVSAEELFVDSVTQQVKPRKHTKFTVETSILQGMKNGRYSCVAAASDRLDHRTSKMVSDLTVGRDGADSLYDDAAPKLESFSWDKSSYDVTSSAAAVNYTIKVSDDTGIANIGIVCDGRYRRVFDSTLIYVANDWHAIGAVGTEITSTLGNPQLSPTLGVSSSIARGMTPGVYQCVVSLMDVRGHRTYAPLPTLKVVRSGSGWDDEPPVMVDFSWDKESYEIGAANDLATGKIHFTDRTGVSTIWLDCYGQTGQRPVSMTLRKNSDGQWFAGGMNNPTVVGTTGTETDFTIELQSDVPFGITPGVQYCFFTADDALGMRSSGAVDQMTVYRIPPGMPGAPTNLRYLPTEGNPNAGTLVWDEPAFLGEKIKDEYGNYKLMPDGRYAGQARDYEIEYSFDGENWIRIKDGYSYTNNLPMSNLYSGKDYYFRVRANNGGNDIAYSKGADWSDVLQTRTPDPSVPGAPTNLQVSNISKSGGTFRWTAPATNGGANITNFKIETSRDEGASWQLVKKAKDKDINSTSVNLTMGGMAPGTHYLVRVSAQNRVGFSEPLIGEITTLEGPATAPLDLSAEDITGNSLSLRWNLPLSNGGRDITNYQIEVSGNNGSTWTKIPHDVSNLRNLTVSNLSKGKRYQFRVAAITSNGVGSVSEVFSATTAITEPAAPTNLVVSGITSGNAGLTWKAPTDNGGSPIIDYLVEVSNDDGENWTEITHNESVAKSFKLSGMRPGGSYRVRVAAVNAAGARNYVEATFSTLSTAPTVPLALVATPESASSVNLNWDIPVNNGGQAISDYKVEGSNNCKTFTEITHDASNSNGFNVTGLAAGTRYCFRVSAKNSVGYSLASEVAAAVTLGNAPEAPTDLGITTAKTSVSLSWNQAPVVGGSAVRDYTVYYSKDGGVTWLTVAKKVSTSRKLTVTGLRGGTTYKFKVTATNDVGESESSNELTAVTKVK